MDVQLFEEVHDECVDLWQQPHEEDNGKTQSEDCRETHTRKCDTLVSLYRFCILNLLHFSWRWALDHLNDMVFIVLQL